MEYNFYDNNGVVDDEAYGQVNLLTDDPKKVLGAAHKLWEKQEPQMEEYLALWRANRLRYSGVSHVRIVKQTTDHTNGRLRVVVPLGAAAAGGLAFNRLPSMCRQLTSLLFSDPPIPSINPSTGEQEDADASEFSSRILMDLQSNANNGLTPVIQAVDKSHVYGSGFVLETVDPRSRKGPHMMLAKKSHRTKADALNEDPYFQEQFADEDLVVRYVMPASSISDEVGNVTSATEQLLTDDPDQAEQIFYPRLRSRVLTGREVRFLPEDVNDINDAHGIIIGEWRQLDEVVPMVKDFIDISDKDALEKLSGVAPKKADELFKERYPNREKADYVWTQVVVYRPCNTYENGLYMLIVGNTIVSRIEWPREIPVAQFKAFNGEGVYGDGLVSTIGPANDVRNEVLNTYIAHYKNYVRPARYLPIQSGLNPSDIRDAGMGTVLPINSQAAIPIQEQVAALPRNITDLLDFATGELEMMSGITNTAVGLATPSVQSAKHVSALTENTNNALSDIRMNVETGLIRWWRIRLQLIKAFFPQVQRLSYVGADGAYKEKSWSGANIKTEVDLQIRPGSFTTLSPQAKSDMAANYLASGVMTPPEAKDIFAASLAPQLGLQEDPVKARVRRQLAKWSEGPNDVLDTADQLATIFDENETDMEPWVVEVRLVELVKFMQSTRYKKWPAEWRLGPLEEFKRMKAALAPPPPPPGEEGPPPEELPPEPLPPEEGLPPEAPLDIPPELLQQEMMQ